VATQFGNTQLLIQLTQNHWFIQLICSHVILEQVL